jgi:hypothetical protein
VAYSKRADEIDWLMSFDKPLKEEVPAKYRKEDNKICLYLTEISLRFWRQN